MNADGESAGVFAIRGGTIGNDVVSCAKVLARGAMVLVCRECECGGSFILLPFERVALIHVHVYSDWKGWLKMVLHAGFVTCALMTI